MGETLLTFEVRAIDGEIIPVPSLEVGARFTYAAAPSTWSSAVTDGDGCARFSDRHPEAPQSVCLYVEDSACGTFPVEDGGLIVLEL